nr:gustatory receptor 19.1 [Papilio polytes]
MSSVYINGYFKNDKIDTISKSFIFILMILGENRLGVFGKMKFVYSLTIFIYCVCLSAIYGYLLLKEKTILYFSNIVIMNVASFIINNILAFIFCKKYREFFDELNSFDKKVGLKFNVCSSMILNVIVCCFIIVIDCIVNLMLYMKSFTTEISMYMRVKNIVFVTELFSYGHMMMLLIQRLQYIKKTAISCLDRGIANSRRGNENQREYEDTTELDMRKLVLLYDCIIKAYDTLNAAIKYQFVLMLLESFFANISFWNLFAIDVISQKFKWTKRGAQTAIIFLTTLIPFFSPCYFASQIKDEVSIMRDNIRSNIHKLVEITSNFSFLFFFADKCKRKAITLLLSLTKIRTLSLSLFRMISVDILLPFKMLGYIATYLIVIMQFEKITGAN